MAYSSTVPGRIALLIFLASLGLNWPDLPFNARLPDLLFVVVVIALMASGARPSFHALDGFAAAYVLGAVPSLAASPHVDSGVIELVREGYLVAIYIVIAAVVRHGYARTIATGLALSGAVLATAGVAFVIARLVWTFDLPALGGVMALPYVGDVLRLRALTASESMLACVLTMAAPFAMAKMTGQDLKGGSRVYVAVTVLLCAAALLTVSHSIAGFTVAVLIASYRLLSPLRLVRTMAVGAAVIAVLGFNFAATASVRSIGDGNDALEDRSAYHYGVDAGSVRVGTTNVEYQVMSYFRLKQIAWEAFGSNPAIGIGLDRFHDATEYAFQRGRLTAAYRAVDPHSTLPGRLAECGLVGGITLLLLWVAFGRAGVRLLHENGPDAWIARAAVAGLAGILVNSVNADVMNFRFVWVGLGLIRGMADRREP